MTIEIVLPTLHNGRKKPPERGGQVEAFWLTREHRFVAVRCGRRWGKTDLSKTIICDAAIKGQSTAIFAPDYKISAEAFNEIAAILEPVRRSSSKVEGVIRTTTNGRIDFWTLENERAGRSRKYHKVVVDEAAFTKPNMMDIWEKSIKPTLLDYRGTALVLSNTNGVDPENFFWRICNQPEHGFTEYHAPTHDNPYLPQDELDKLQRDNHPLVYQQEYLADFVDFSGSAFFALEYLLDPDGKPAEWPKNCDTVFAVIDTAVKQGKEHDGTAVSYWARNRFAGFPLVCLDWDIISIDGALLETWIPNVFRRLEELAKACGARMGSTGAWIEDAQSGSILLQQCARRGFPAKAINSDLTSAGKDARALSVSGYVYRREVMISGPAYDKTMSFKGQTRNHFLSQVTGFRVGDKAAATRADDLADTFTYAISIALGDSEGH